MRLLVVEDETKTGNYIRQGLSEAGFVVELVRNGLDGYHLAMTESFDLIILDVMLPDVDGWRIMQSYRDAGHQTPVLFLTARDSVDDRVKGLELGADDYLVKPFAFAELLARIRTLLRRRSMASPAEQIQVADLTLDLLKHRVSRAARGSGYRLMGFIVGFQVHFVSHPTNGMNQFRLKIVVDLGAQAANRYIDNISV